MILLNYQNNYLGRSSQNVKIFEALLMLFSTQLF